MTARCLRLKPTSTGLVYCLTDDAMEPPTGRLLFVKSACIERRSRRKQHRTATPLAPPPPISAVSSSPPIAGFSHLHEPGKAAATVPAGAGSSNRQAKVYITPPIDRPMGLARRPNLRTSVERATRILNRTRDCGPDFAPNAKGGCRNRLRLLYYRLYNISFK